MEIISEEFGSEKPCVKNYEVVMNKFPERKIFIYVGDNPAKDQVFLENGEYKCKTRIMSIKDENSLCRYCICKNAGFSFGF
jgi:hypothetical protein